ncbi:hypothetical protein B0H14DRAFT_3521320 [Mycena olivaceomarginata]|nr:hypothetical protein B0H14DRAFT_3521320 [Mycena olivaceomarginata]
MDPLTDGQLSVRENTNDPHFPQELVDQVLRELDPSNLFDSRTLRTCALVSHTWLRLSRARPFAPTSDIEVVNHPHTETNLAHLLAQFPALMTLWLVMDPIDSAIQIIALQVQYQFARQQERERNAGVHRADTSRLFRGRHIVIRVEEPMTKPSPFVIPEHVPLSTLRIVHLAYSLHNAKVLALLSPPALDALHLTVRESDPEAVHASLRAAGSSLRVLVVDFPNDLRIGHTTTALHTTLCVLRLRAHTSP